MRRPNVGSGVGAGVSMDVGVGLADAVGVAPGVGAIVGLGRGVAEALARGVGEGVTVTTITRGEGVGATVGDVCTPDAGTVGATVGAVTVGRGVASCTRPADCGVPKNKLEAAQTPPTARTATSRIVATNVPVVRSVPRRICARRSPSQLRCACRRCRSATTAAKIRASNSGLGATSGKVASSSMRREAPASSANVDLDHRVSVPSRAWTS